MQVARTSLRRPQPRQAFLRAIGAEAARKGLRVFDCPYSHPAMRASWLKGFAQEQQQQLDF
ncbi:CrpP family ICE-associated protein [Pseudomonas aeruginosa]|uniref:CrpP family ICE-associated protein n=1 Tax=Pseudomonas aeruginosa TaxID=287 RepID=UPI0024A77197|nr:CrpP family ICE-associated protein [Pseudomonas aeruginosa]